MSGRHPFSKLTENFTPEQWSRIEAAKEEIRASMAVYLKFLKAFPDLYSEKKADYTFAFGPCGYRGATVYFRKTRAGPNQARIRPEWLKNFPNSDGLAAYLKNNKIPLDPSASHPDYLIGPEHADEVIALLKKGLSARPSTGKGLGAPVTIATEVTG